MASPRFVVLCLSDKGCWTHCQKAFPRQVLTGDIRLPLGDRYSGQKKNMDDGSKVNQTADRCGKSKPEESMRKLEWRCW